MQSFPLNILEPFMGLDVFCVVWKDVPAGIVLILVTGRNLMVIGSISLATETAVFFLDNATNQVLASPTNYWFVGERKHRFVILSHDKLALGGLERATYENVHLSLLPASFGQKRRVAIEALFLISLNRASILAGCPTSYKMTATLHQSHRAS